MEPTLDGSHVHVVDRIANVVEVFDREYNQTTYDLSSEDGRGNGLGPCMTRSVSDDPGLPANHAAPDLMDLTPDGEYMVIVFLSYRTYAFGILDWEQDKPANIDSATRQIIGIGHQFFSNDSGFLSAEAGIGKKNTELVTGDDVDGGIGYLGLNYLNRINDNVTFNADLRSDFGSDNTFVEIGLGAAFKVSEKLALKVSHF